MEAAIDKRTLLRSFHDGLPEGVERRFHAITARYTCPRCGGRDHAVAFFRRDAQLDRQILRMMCESNTACGYLDAGVGSAQGHATVKGVGASTKDDPPHSAIFRDQGVAPDPQDLRRFLELIAVPDGVFEIRALNVPSRGTVTGYFDAAHITEAVEAAASLSGRATGVYVTLNPVNPKLQARAHNRLRDFTPKGEGVGDHDIVRRRFLPLDFDYDRPAGISSTDEEHKVALDRMQACVDALEAEGLSPLLIADSGNGGHILLAIDLLNEPASLKLIETVFKAIKARFGDPPIKFDVTNSNAARIWKTYGTLAAKGDSTAERPHRLARILALRTDDAVFEDMVITGAQLETIAGQEPEQEQPRVHTDGRGRGNTALDLDQWISRHNVPLELSHVGSDGWSVYLYRDQDVPCPFTAAHDARGFFVKQGPEGAIKAGCQHESCGARRQRWFEFREMYEPRGHYDRENYGGIFEDDKQGNTEPEWPELEPPELELPAVLPITEDLFPEPLRAWALDIAGHVGVPLDYLYAALMPVLGSLIGRRLALRPQQNNPKWLVVPNLWGMLIGPPGSGKTPTTEEVQAPVRKLMAEAIAEHTSRKKSHDEALRQWEQQKKQRGQDPGPEPEKPTERRYQVNEFTVEKLGEIIKENPNGILIYHDELTGLLRGMERQGHQTDRAFLLRGANGNSPFSFDSIGRGTIHLPPVCLSLLGSINPGPLSKYLVDLFGTGASDDGFVQRLQLAVWPNPSDSDPQDRPGDLNIYGHALEIFRRLERFDPQLRLEAKVNEHDAHPVPYIGFSAAAQAIFDDCERDRRGKIKICDEPPPQKSHFAKYAKLISSLALIYHVIDIVHAGGSESAVSEHATHKARRACKVLASHARRIYSPLARKTGAALIDDLLYRKIVNGALVSGFTVRDVQRRNWVGLDDAEKLKDATVRFTEWGILRRARVQADKGTGRPRGISFEINPKIREPHGSGDPE